jgi:glycosyltransferase involved in cell wall biosynthesis
LRICIVSQYFWPENFRVNDLVQALAGAGHEVQVLTGQPNYPNGKVAPGYRTLLPRRSEAVGSKVLRVPLVPRGKASGLRLVANYFSFATSATIFGVAGIRKPVDVVLAYEPSPVTVAVPALAVAKRLGAPALMWIQDLWPDTLRATGAVSDGLALNAAGWLTRRLHRAMDGLLVQSPAFVPILEAQGVEPSRITYLPNWAESHFRPMAVPANAEERRELPSGFVILFAGNIGVAQGFEVLLGAADRLRDEPAIQWVVLGDGRRADWLRNEVKRRHLTSVHLLGPRPQESMPIWFALAGALLATLKSDPVYELTIPSKIQAYLACGRPILASMDGVGAREVESSNAGLATPAGDAEALAVAARKLYQMTADKRSAMGTRAKAHYERNFDRDTLVRRLESVLEQAVKSRSRAEATA